MGGAKVLGVAVLVASAACSVDSPTDPGEPQVLGRIKGSFEVGTGKFEIGPDVAPGTPPTLNYYYYDPTAPAVAPINTVSVYTYRNYEPGAPVTDMCDPAGGGCAPIFGKATNLGNCADHTLCAFVAVGCKGGDSATGWTANNVNVVFDSFDPPTDGIKPMINVAPDGSGGAPTVSYLYGNASCNEDRPTQFLGSPGANSGFFFVGENGTPLAGAPPLAGWFISVPTDGSFTFSAHVTGFFTFTP